MLTVKEISQELKVTDRTVRRWIKESHLKAIKIQGVVRIEEEEFNRFIEEAKR